MKPTNHANIWAFRCLRGGPNGYIEAEPTRSEIERAYDRESRRSAVLEPEEYVRRDVHEAEVEKARRDGAEVAYAAVMRASGYMNAMGDVVARARRYAHTVLNVEEPKPAPVEAGERYAVLTKSGWFVRLGGIGNEGRFVGSREEAERNAPGFGPVVRVLEDGAHEATVKEAREQGRVEAFAEANALLDKRIKAAKAGGS